MNQPHSPPVAAQQDLRNILSNASLTMRELAGVVGQLETQLLKDVARLQADDASLTALQSVDLLTQALTEMDGMFGRLGAAVPASVAVDSNAVLGPIKLEQLRIRLSDRDPELAAPPPATDHQSIAMF